MVQTRVLWAPKDGNSDDQYEDACAVAPPKEDAPFTVALSDGASSAMFAREWAKMLAETFVSGFPPTDEAARETIAALGREWRTQVEGRATSWYAQERLPGGSSATLLVVTWDTQTLRWSACSVGDVCVFLVRNDKLVYAFPVTKASGFDDRPALVSTENTKPLQTTRYEESYQTGDRFLLMTDAIAAYFLSEYEARRKPWNDLPQNQEAVLAWLKARRDGKRLKNDDVTLVEILF